MEFIIGILTLPIIFWTMFSLGIWWLIWAAEEESISGAFWAMLCGGTLAIIKFGSFSSFFEAIKANPFLILIVFTIYLVIGTAWSFFKWYLFVGDKAKYIQARIDQNGKASAAKEFATGYGYARNDNEKEILNSNFSCLAPDVKNYKEKIITWIVLWAPSFIWFLVNDPIRRAAKEIFDHAKGLFQLISDRAFKSAFRID